MSCLIQTETKFNHLCQNNSDISWTNVYIQYIPKDTGVKLQNISIVTVSVVIFLNLCTILMFCSPVLQSRGLSVHVQDQGLSSGGMHGCRILSFELHLRAEKYPGIHQTSPPWISLIFKTNNGKQQERKIYDSLAQRELSYSIVFAYHLINPSECDYSGFTLCSSPQI